MTKAEAEKVLRPQIRAWAHETGFDPTAGKQPSYSDFKKWAMAKELGSCWSFRSVRGSDEDVEQWFDEELGQTWRN